LLNVFRPRLNENAWQCKFSQVRLLMQVFRNLWRIICARDVNELIFLKNRRICASKRLNLRVSITATFHWLARAVQTRKTCINKCKLFWARSKQIQAFESSRKSIQVDLQRKMQVKLPNTCIDLYSRLNGALLQPIRCDGEKALALIGWVWCSKIACLHMWWWLVSASSRLAQVDLSLIHRRRFDIYGS